MVLGFELGNNSFKTLEGFEMDNTEVDEPTTTMIDEEMNEEPTTTMENNMDEEMDEEPTSTMMDEEMDEVMEDEEHEMDLKTVVKELKDNEKVMKEAAERHQELMAELTKLSGLENNDKVKAIADQFKNSEIEGFVSKINEPFVGSKTFYINFLRTLLKAVLLGLVFFLLNTNEAKTLLKPVTNAVNKVISAKMLNVLIFIVIAYTVLVL